MKKYNIINLDGTKDGVEALIYKHTNDLQQEINQVSLFSDFVSKDKYAIISNRSFLRMVAEDISQNMSLKDVGVKYVDILLNYKRLSNNHNMINILLVLAST